MNCCAWKRSKNDILLDSETNKSYCGTCWQQWFENEAGKQPLQRPATVAQPTKQPTENSTEEEHALVEDDDTIGELEGFSHTDDKLYLLSRKRGLVFLPERTDDGKLRCAGEIVDSDGATDIKLYKVHSVSKTIQFPYPTSSEDHCETPFVAYADIAPFLEHLARLLGKDRKTLRIWDPYYCNGAVKVNFARLGFPNVHNECEDFYSVVRSGKIPTHDCIVSNPPYSTEPRDHIHELFKILCRQKKPWFVVQPNYVYVKEFWNELTSAQLTAPRPFFLTPESARKYKYKTPSGIRVVGSAQNLKTSPFVSMWYCWLGAKYTEKMYRWIALQCKRQQVALQLACSEYFLPDMFKDSNDKTRRKKRKGANHGQDGKDTRIGKKRKRRK